MRLLSKLEQQLCWLILQGDGHYNYLANILDDYLPDAKIYVSKQEEQEVYILYKMFARDRENFPFDERDAQIRRLILVTVNLIKLLEQEGYIMLFMSTTVEPNLSIGAGPDKIISVDGEEEIIETRSDIEDASVIKLLTEYNPKEIYVTEEFRAFCANGCIPRSDVQFNQNLELTKQSLELAKQSLDKAEFSNWVAIATLIITILSFVVSVAANWGWRPSFFS
ncbi:hypothetical protein [uncultured Porphyromonas sp.]|uniref:hypothetical protein n=1 Tax=uncultured Porphyromonas sp. TaxID=159274 RepID=UPI00258A0276|nr:hypothetical protein [uncultured Porphyromonas sp.]